ncbi:hypothetical protein AX774_g7215 [Zancudomyces culisetae]|uniref:Uncharacterized protein n=1 Tax=Zancudomyces culisetae TaxID=1213189 RepID=A0A1R1PEI6_ZANCU|nr:hypothetical protein AX774_g7215 [Zancudomyces culisetae]|eukprot:OMH79371.1 hypothetical protein AX774_g7215 [Zancudomyces culisetae]
MLVLRTMKNKSTGYSPAEMLYGIQMEIPSTWKPNGTNENEEEEFKNRIQLIKEDLPQIRELGIKGSVKAKKYDEVRYNRKVEIYNFKIGDFVLKLIEYEQAKLERVWEGPYKVENRLDKGTYIISDQFGNRDLVHGDILKQYNTSTYMIPEVTTTLKSKLRRFRQKAQDEGIHA